MVGPKSMLQIEYGYNKQPKIDHLTAILHRGHNTNIVDLNEWVEEKNR